MKARLIALSTATLLSMNTAFAAGRITQINVAGPDDPNHPNVVQLVIEGGVSGGTCDTTFSAIRNTADRKELIAYAFTAYASGQSVNIVLNTTDKYFGSRCTISRISNQ